MIKVSILLRQVLTVKLRSVNEWMGPEAGDLRPALPLLERIGECL